MKSWSRCVLCFAGAILLLLGTGCRSSVSAVEPSEPTFSELTVENGYTTTPEVLASPTAAGTPTAVIATPLPTSTPLPLTVSGQVLYLKAVEPEFWDGEMEHVEIWLLDLASGQTELLYAYDPRSTFNFPGLASPNGRYYLSSSEANLFLLDVASKEIIVVEDEPVRHFTWSLDGESIYYLVPPSSEETSWLRRVTLPLDDDDPYIYPAALSPEGEGWWGFPRWVPGDDLLLAATGSVENRYPAPAVTVLNDLAQGRSWSVRLPFEDEGDVIITDVWPDGKTVLAHVVRLLGPPRYLEAPSELYVGTLQRDGLIVDPVLVNGGVDEVLWGPKFQPDGSIIAQASDRAVSGLIMFTPGEEGYTASVIEVASVLGDYSSSKLENYQKVGENGLIVSFDKTELWLLTTDNSHPPRLLAEGAYPVVLGWEVTKLP